MNYLGDGFSLFGIYSVSYTHLDVYKRQTQASQEASAVLTNANQVTPAVPVQAETVTEPAHEGQTVDMQILSTTCLLYTSSSDC